MFFLFRLSMKTLTALHTFPLPKLKSLTKYCMIKPEQNAHFMIMQTAKEEKTIPAHFSQD